MKFNKIAAICKSRKRVYIYNDPDTGAQWLGDGVGMYLLDGMPRLTPEECLRLFDVPESKHAEYYCQTRDLPEGIDFSDETGVYRDDLSYETITIGWLGGVYRLFKDGAELHAINEAYLSPFAGDLNYVKYHRREFKDGTFLLGINIGLGLQAVICPGLLHQQEPFTDVIVKIAESFLHMKRNFPRKEPTETPENNPEQQTLEE